MSNTKRCANKCGRVVASPATNLCALSLKGRNCNDPNDWAHQVELLEAKLARVKGLAVEINAAHDLLSVHSGGRPLAAKIEELLFVVKN